jgi:CHAD domain-containing protein
MHNACEIASPLGKIGEVQTATETERKYDVPAGFELPSLIGAADVNSAEGAQSFDLDATYFDTDDLRLARNKRTLRRRTGGSDAGWHLKTPGDGSSRTEHRLPLDGEVVPDELQSEVRAIVRERALRPVARLRTHRVETPLRDAAGRTLALVAQDQVTAETDGGEQHWQEVEVELVDGGPQLLEAVERELLAAGAKPAAGPSKLVRALGDRLPAPEPTTTEVSPVLAYAREQRDAIAAYDPGVRHGDPESVHKMRVASRRLRSTLKTFKRSFAPEPASRIGPELKWLAQQLGEVRDGQVLSHKLLASVEREGAEFAPVAQRIRENLDAKVARGREALAEDLDSQRYLALLDATDELVGAPDTTENDPLRRVRKALKKADDLLDRATADGVDAELHEARKAYKRARYAVEVFVPSVGKRAKQLTKALTNLQDVLGAHQDSVVAREILHDLASSADDGFRYGVLYARQEQVGRDTFGDLPVAVKAAGKTKLRSWLA